MKKSILLGVLFFSSSFLFSQSHFGVLAGVNNASISDGFLRKVGIDKVFSFHLGGVYEYEFNKNISFRPKMIFSLQGDRAENNASDSGNFIDYKLTYLNLPINFKFFSKPYILVGPQVGFLLETNKGDRDYGDIISSLDYGLNLGLGHDFNDFFVEFNIYQGISKLMEFGSSTPRNYVYYGSGATNTVLQISVGYFFY